MKKRTPCSSSPRKSARPRSSPPSPTTWARRHWTRWCTTSPIGAPKSGPAAPMPRATIWAGCPGTARTSWRRWGRSTGPAPIWPVPVTSMWTAPCGWDTRQRTASLRQMQQPAASWPVRPDGRARGVRRFVVAYTATDSGREAVNLATALARRQGGSLDLVMVLPESSPYSGAYPRPESGYDSILSDQIREWLAEGLSLVPDDVTARAHVRPAESNAEGLIAAAEEFGAALIVIGAGRNSVFRRFSVGTVASGLLHASTVPVALAPRGYRRTEPITRITVGVGNR